MRRATMAAASFIKLIVWLVLQEVRYIGSVDAYNAIQLTILFKMDAAVSI